MSIKILTQNSIDNTNIDGARQNHFSAGMRSGIVRGAFNEGKFFASASNIIALDSCELRISGHQVVIDSTETITLNDRPSTPTKYSMIAEIQVSDSSVPSFRLFIQPANVSLKKDNLFKTNNGSGTYQLRIGNFTLGTTGLISDVVRTADIITGGGEGGIADIKFNATATQLSSSSQPEVNADYNEETKEWDLSFGIPAGSGSKVTIGGVEQPTWSADFAESERQKSKNLLQNTLEGFELVENTYGQDTVIYEKERDVNYPLCFYFKGIDVSYPISSGGALWKFNYSDGTTSYLVGTMFNENNQSYTHIFDGSKDLVRITLLNWSDNVGTLDFAQLEENNHFTGYQPYNGAIVHKKDLADFEHIETLYDMTNPNLDLGYSSGIDGNLGINISYNFTKYKKVIAYCCSEFIGSNIYSSMFSIELDLFKKTAAGTHPYRAITTTLNPYVALSQNPDSQLIGGILEVDANKTYFGFKGFSKQPTTAVTMYNGTKLMKLEGVLL